MTRLAAAVSLLAGLGAAEPPVDVQRPEPRLVTGEEFQSALQRPITATWRHVPLRSLLNALSKEREISILLDRRVDPDRELPWDFTGRPLVTELADLAARHGAALSVLPNAVYIGPPDAVRKLRTIVHQREEELLAIAKSKDSGRDLELLRKSVLNWGDLARPADLVSRVASAYRLNVERIDQIPHDLWAGATVPSATAIESLMVVLIQFDLMFDWTDNLAGMRIVRTPEKFAIMRVYSPKNLDPVKTVEQWSAALPGAQIASRNGKILVTGSIEEHEAVEALLRPRLLNGATDPTTASPAPLNRQTFTLKVQQVPVRAVMQELEKRGVIFRYDARALAAAGVDLDTRINLDVEKLDADAFFRAVFDPLKLKFQIDRLTVTLSPREPAAP